MEYRGQTLSLVTASLGVAAFPEYGEDWEELIHAADAAMYRAKREGRNRVVVAQNLNLKKPKGRSAVRLAAGTKVAPAR